MRRKRLATAELAVSRVCFSVVLKVPGRFSRWGTMSFSRTRIPLRAVALGSALLLVSAASAGAAGSNQAKVQMTDAGQAAATAAVLTLTELGSGTGWSGGSEAAPAITSDQQCAGFHPKQSDLVVNGTAATAYRHSGVSIFTQSRVFATPAMVALDWQRHLGSAGLIPCLRTAFQTAAKGTSVQFVSVSPLDVPQIGTHSSGYRIVLKRRSTGVQVMSDVVLVTRGRTEVTVGTTSVLAAASYVQAAEIHVAQLLAGRIAA
jgi:hypothetical protein